MTLGGTHMYSYSLSDLYDAMVTVYTALSRRVIKTYFLSLVIANKTVSTVDKTLPGND